MTAATQPLSSAFRLKRSVAQISLLSLATAFEIVSRHSPDLQAELADWEDGRVFALGVLGPDAPAVTMRKQGNRVEYLGRGVRADATLVIYFKNIDSALLPLTGQMGSATAFVQHRAALHGAIHDAVQLNRAMDVVQWFLMPGLVLQKTMKRPPKLTGSQLLLKARVMATLGLGLVLNWGK